MAYSLMKRLIDLVRKNKSRKTKEELLNMCDVYFACERITNDEMEELVTEINDLQ